MKIIISALAIVVGIYWIFSFFTGYRSAFEADQACHYERSNIYADNSNYDCDHDLETNQWILYHIEGNNQPAKVLKRFRY